MGQLLIRQVDDADIARLKARARDQKTSVEALVRVAIRDAARLTVSEKLALVDEMQQWSRVARIPGSPQSLGVDLIREDRELDH